MGRICAISHIRVHQDERRKVAIPGVYGLAMALTNACAITRTLPAEADCRGW